MPNISRFPQSDQTALLRATNEKIAALAAVAPASEIQSAFTLVAQLAMEALGTAIELRKIPGIDNQQIEDVVDFWYSLAEHARSASLACVGGSQSLAEATVAFLFLQTSCARKPASAEAARPDGKGKVVPDVG